MAGVVVRLGHRLAERALGLLHLLFADDGWLTTVGKFYWRPILFWFFVLDILEVPLSWEKVRGGEVVSWIGYELDVKGFKRGISQRKVDWVSN